MERHGVAVMIRVVDTYEDETRTWFVGPFMPHVGSATTRAVDALENDVDATRSREVCVEDLFLAPGESDLQGFR